MREKLIELMTAYFGVDPAYYGIEAAHLADHLIANGVTVQEWISVKDRLPESWKDVLAFYEDKTISIDAMSDGGKWYSDYVRTNKITHWMPLPKPPKGE